MTEKRKVQKTGGSTFIVSLPKDWARTRLKEGDSIWIEKEENSLKLMLEEEKEEDKEVTIQYEEPIDSLLRKIIASYLVGYDRIKIKSSEIIEKKEEIERLVREKMMGLEITGETSKKIELQNLLKHSDLPTHQVLSRMDSIIKGMYEDVLGCFKNDKKEILEDVIKRENEVDRLYLLGVRQIKSGIRSDRIMKKLEVQSKLLCLGYRIIFKSLERIGDHLKKIAENLLEIEEIPIKEKLKEIGNKSLSSYEKAIKSLFDLDGELAENSIQMSKEIDKNSEDLNRSEYSKETSFQIKSIIESIDRTRKLSRDIAEIVINLSAGELESKVKR